MSKLHNFTLEELQAAHTKLTSEASEAIEYDQEASNADYIVQDAINELVQLRIENESLIAFVQQLSQARVLCWYDTAHFFKPHPFYSCPFCIPGEEGDPNEGKHAPECLVIQAQQFLEKRKGK